MSRLAVLRNSRPILAPVALTGLLAGYERWSDASTWLPGLPPQRTDSVVIAPGKKIVVDVWADVLDVDNGGDLTFAPDRRTGIRTQCIDNAGLVWAGSLASRHTAPLTFTFYGAEVGRTARIVWDELSRTGGNGRIAHVDAAAGAAAGTTRVITFGAGGTTFTVAGVAGTGTVGVPFAPGTILIIFIEQGTIPWVSGNTITLESVQMGFTNDGEVRCFHNRPGARGIQLYGVDVGSRRRRVNANVTAGDAGVTIEAVTGWPAGSRVAVGSTDWYGQPRGTTELRTLNVAATAAAAAFSAPLANAKYGLLQYLTDAGWSNTPGTLTNAKGMVTAVWNEVPKTMDQRAPVQNLSSNIVFEGEDDIEWQTSGFGGHLMHMSRVANSCQLVDVEFRRMGQTSLGRYPIHAHSLSYDPVVGFKFVTDATYTGPVVGHFVRNCAVWNSSNRGAVIHATRGFEVTDTAFHDILGHCVFTEDGSEMDNLVSRNSVGKVRLPVRANALVRSDFWEQGSVGIWISNPQNTVEDNWSFDCEGPGMWFAFYPRCFGLSSAVTLTPQFRGPTALGGNHSWGNKDAGINNQGRHFNNRGDMATYSTVPLRWLPTVGGVDSASPTRITDIPFPRQTIWKCLKGYLNDVSFPRYDGWLTSDNGDQCFEGTTQSGFPSFITSTVVWGISLNNNTPYSATGRRPQQGLATYHGTLVPRDCVIGGFPYTTAAADLEFAQRGGGTFNMADQYIGAVSGAFDGCVRIQYIGAAPCWLSKGTTNTSILTGMARVIHDPNGIFSATAGAYWIANEAFTSFGANILSTVPNGGDTNGFITNTRYFGVGEFWTNTTTQFAFQDAITVERLTSALTLRSSRSYVGGTGFKHFEVQQGTDVYRLVFNTTAIPTSRMQFEMSHFWLTTDTAKLIVPWSSAVTPTTVSHSTPSQTKNLTLVGSLALWQADTTGAVWFKDGANQIYLSLKADLAGITPGAGLGGPLYTSTVRILA